MRGSRPREYSQERLDAICQRLMDMVQNNESDTAYFTMEEMTEAEALELKDGGWVINRLMRPSAFLSNPPKVYQHGWSITLPN